MAQKHRERRLTKSRELHASSRGTATGVGGRARDTAETDRAPLQNRKVACDAALQPAAAGGDTVRAVGNRIGKELSVDQEIQRTASEARQPRHRLTRIFFRR